MTPMDRSAKKQFTVARSSAKAKYRALTFIAAEFTWISFILWDIGLYLKDPPTLLCDNMSTLHFGILFSCSYSAYCDWLSLCLRLPEMPCGEYVKKSRLAADRCTRNKVWLVIKVPRVNPLRKDFGGISQGRRIKLHKRGALIRATIRAVAGNWR